MLHLQYTPNIYHVIQLIFLFKLNIYFKKHTKQHNQKNTNRYVKIDESIDGSVIDIVVLDDNSDECALVIQTMDPHGGNTFISIATILKNHQKCITHRTYSFKSGNVLRMPYISC